MPVWADYYETAVYIQYLRTVQSSSVQEKRAMLLILMRTELSYILYLCCPLYRIFSLCQPIASRATMSARIIQFCTL